MDEKIYKLGDVAPEAGRYQCTVCGIIVEYSDKHIEQEVKFGVCPLCMSGTEDGPKKPHEDFWKKIS